MSTAEAARLFAALEPSERHRVIDLVRDAGANVDGWAVKRGGLPVENPSGNPAYCFEWAFGEGAEPVVLCVWYDTLELDGAQIVYRDNLRRLAMRLEERAIDRRESDKNRSRAKSQAPRARDFDHRIQQGWNSQLPVRLILLKGARADNDSLGRDRSSVEFRRLDSEPWRIAHYDMMTGDFQFVRGAANAQDASLGAGIQGDLSGQDTVSAPPYVDQFDVTEAPARREVQGTAYARSALVRAEVLRRAAGICEACGETGFRMANGAIYLETHHVVPLSQSGPDIEWNVVAVCANDHRIAHFGEFRVEWRDRMLDHLSTCYPKIDVTRRLLGLVS